MNSVYIYCIIFLRNLKLGCSVRRGPCSFFYSFLDTSGFLARVGYRGAMAAGKAAAETKGRVAKDTFPVSLPGAGVWILPGVGVDGAVTDAGGDRD